jgi:hypothetical protein
MRSRGLRAILVMTTLAITTSTIVLTVCLLWPTLHRWWAWKQYQRDPYSENKFARHMGKIIRHETFAYRSWYISGVFRARRGREEPFWVVQINGSLGSGRLLVNLLR